MQVHFLFQVRVSASAKHTRAHDPFPVDRQIAERCSGHNVIMVCCATQKQDSGKTKLKTTRSGFRAVRPSSRFPYNQVSKTLHSFSRIRALHQHVCVCFVFARVLLTLFARVTQIRKKRPLFPPPRRSRLCTKREVDLNQTTHCAKISTHSSRSSPSSTNARFDAIITMAVEASTHG